MGKSSKTTGTTQQNTTMTTTPTNAPYVDSTLANITGKVNDLSNSDPYSLIAGPDALQTQAGTGAAGLTSPQGFADASSALKTSMGGTAPSIAGHLAEFQDPYTDSVVKNSLAGFDQNSGLVNAQHRLDLGNDATFGGSGGSITDALTRGQQALSRGQLESGIRDEGFKTALTGATAQAGLDSGTLAQHIAAASAASGNATAQGADARGNIDTQGGIGAILQAISQAKAGAPLALTGATAGILGSLPLGLEHGSTSDGSLSGTTTGTTKQQGADLSDWLNYFASNAKAAASAGG